MNSNLEREIKFSSLLKFAFPTIMVMIFTSFYTIVDGIFVAKLLGSKAFSAINIVYPIINIILAIGTMFGTGVSAIIGKKIGEGKKDEAKQDFSFIIYFSIFLGIIILILFLTFLPQILYLLGSNDEIYEYCYDYAIVLIFFIPMAILQLVFQNLFITNGTPRIGLITTLIGGVANIVLDYLFMGVLNTGIMGASLATGIGMSIPAVFGLIYFLVKRNGNICLVKTNIKKDVLIKTMANGSSEMISNLSTAVTTFIFNNIMMKLIGTEGVSAIGIILYIDFIFVGIGLGYSMGVAPLISYNYGKDDSERLTKIYNTSVSFNFIIGILACIITLLFDHQLVSIFVSSNDEAFSLALMGLRIFSFSYIYKGYSIFISSMFTAFSNGKVSAIISFNRTLVFSILFTIIFSVLMGSNGLWVGICVAEFMAFILSVFYSSKYKETYKLNFSPSTAKKINKQNI